MGMLDRWTLSPSEWFNVLAPREWVEAQGFVLADAILASVLLALVLLSYMMLAHMFRGWSGDAFNASATAPSGSASAAASRPHRAAPAATPASAAVASSGSSSDTVGSGGGRGSGGGGGGGGAGAGGPRVASCADYGPVQGEVDGMTALMRASSQGDEVCAAELIAAGASVDARDSQEGFTALLMASAMGMLRRPSRVLHRWPSPAALLRALPLPRARPHLGMPLPHTPHPTRCTRIRTLARLVVAG